MDKYDSKFDSIEHKRQVERIIRKIVIELNDRSLNHDNSKLEEPEKSIFDKYTPMLKEVTYGSDEYKQYLADMKIALDHHYANNRHHIDHFSEGTKGMDLVDLVECICDWKAATLRHNDGDIVKSIEINQARFGYSDELKQIFLNTLKYFE